MKQENPQMEQEVRFVYQRMVSVMLDFTDLKDLEKTVHPDFIGYGSAAHEFFQTREDLKKMAQMQKDQLEGQGFRYDRRPVAMNFFADGSSCLILEEFDLFFAGVDHQLLLRLSSLLECIDGEWLVTHVHGSTPDPDIAEEEAFPEEGLRKKNEELEAKIRERTRELEIGAALERARAQSMLMQHSSELNSVSNVFHEQLLLLGIDSEFSFVWLPNESREDHLFWTTWTETVDGELVFHNKSISYPLDLSDPYNAACIADWESGVAVHEHFVPPEEIETFFESWKEMLEGATHLKAEFFPEGIYYTEAFMKYGCFGIDIRRPLTEEEKSVLHRFAIEFERAYTRFLDLKKAEAQTRQAEIELALERVRASTMAMHDSGDLAKVASVLFEQMRLLGGDLFAFGIVLCDKDTPEVEQWHSLGDKGMMSPFKVPVGLDYIHQYRYDQWKAGEPLFSIEIPEDYIQEHFQRMFDLPSVKASMDEVAAKGVEVTVPPWEIDYGASFSHGYLLVSSLKPFGEDHIFPRFARVFEQAYTRFLDLQKAEAQAREAQIELGLERVRARAMAMQKSSELSDLVATVLDELTKLDFSLTFCIINIYNVPDGSNMVWAANPLEGKAPESYYMRFEDYPFHHAMMREWKAQKPKFVYVMEGREKAVYDDYLYNETEFRRFPDEIKTANRAKDRYVASFTFSPFGGLQTVGDEPLSEASLDILYRFGKVFDQTYTRFLDLQKAEQQAREAQIESSLERLRSKAMSMQQSDELHEVLAVLFEQFDILGIRPMSTHMTILDIEHNEFTFRETGKYGNRSFGEHTFALDAMDTWKDMVESWQNSEPFTVNRLHFPKESLPQVWEVFQESFASMPEESRIYPEDYPEGIYHTAGKHPFGYMGMNQVRPATKEEEQIVVKFANEFGRVYQRFLDLQKAEAQAREAQIETALERVRSRTMAMQHSDELAEASHLLDREVRGLGIKTWGCAFNIYRENDSIEWFGNEAGLLPTYTVPREGIFKEYYDRGQKGETLFIKEIAGEECIAHYEYMSTLPVVGEVLRQLKETNGSFPSYQIDHVVYFKYGYLLFITREEVPEAHDIFKRFAKVFEQTYTRFLDLQLKEEQAVKLVEEKQRLEKTLSDLQATQQQLIHAEKMASLGELTAGIAHEIQNPLNFVNNFSEVSRELLEEMVEELKNGDPEEVDAIAQDVIQNLEKILHHGKRADSIVKGMLQHSRSGDGIKEPTDLNALADEYLRLAYHGLRAKDKSFNAHMETDFDQAVKPVEVIPQDIGRVLLNLITNAFHAVGERKLKEPGGYDPTVWVKTKKTEGGVELSVRDNGSGIPDKIKDKIFQPFFTTKPTGEGTGLGLSMSYDIVNKGHGGELTMVTTVGEGTVFKIVLPATPEKA